MNRFNSEKVCLGMKWNEPVPAIETGCEIKPARIPAAGAGLWRPGPWRFHQLCGIWGNHGTGIIWGNHLVVTNRASHGFSMALIEIDGLPNLIAWVDLSMANCECHNQMVIIWLVVWNMAFIFPYIGNNNTNWLSYFSEGLKPRTSHILTHTGNGW